jgi:hypothetical protein
MKTLWETRLTLYAKGIYALEPEIRVISITTSKGQCGNFSGEIKCNRSSGQRGHNSNKECQRELHMLNSHLSYLEGR